MRNPRFARVAEDLGAETCECCKASAVGSEEENLLGTVGVLLTSVARSCRYPLLVLPAAPMQAEHVLPLRVSHSLECHATL